MSEQRLVWQRMTRGFGYNDENGLHRDNYGPWHVVPTKVGRVGVTALCGVTVWRRNRADVQRVWPEPRQQIAAQPDGSACRKCVKAAAEAGAGDR